MENIFNPFDNFDQKDPIISTKIIKKQYNPEISKKYFKNQNQNSIEYIIKNIKLSDKKKIELIKHLYLNINKESQIQIQEFIFYS